MKYRSRIDLMKAKDKDDKLRVILNSLGKLPEYDLTDDDLDRELQLELVDRFGEETAKKNLQEEQVPLQTQARDTFIDLMKIVELDNNSSNLIGLLDIAKSSKEAGAQDLIVKIEHYLLALEKEKSVCLILLPFLTLFSAISQRCM